MRLKHTAIFLLLCVFCCSVSAQTASDYYDSAMKAYKAKDYKTFVENLQKVLAAGANHPRIYYNLACGYALVGDSVKSIEALNHIATLGIAYPVDQDADLQSVRSTPEFQKVVEQFKHNQEPVTHSTVAFTLPEQFIPEGLTYDAASKKFYAGSILEKKITEIDSKGKSTDLSAPTDGLYEALGMSIDHKHNFLWVSSAQFIDADTDAKKVSALFRYDLNSRKLVKRYDLPADQPHQLGDVIVNKEGDAYTTDSLNPAIYRVDHRTDRLEKWEVGDLFRSPQGLAFSPDEKLLYVADYVRGLFAIDLATNKGVNLKAPANATVAGIDGLYQYKGQLIATQNGFTPNRILRISLSSSSDQIDRVDVMEAANPANGEFTLGVIVGDEFYYVATSQLEKYYDDHKAKLEPTTIRKLTLR